MRSSDAGERLRAALDGRLDGALLTDDVARSLWATDASIYLRRPEAVVVARSEADVRRTLGAARAVGVPVTPRGTGTALAGQATAPGLALDFAALDRGRGLRRPPRARARVEPGAIQAELNAHAAPDGLVFGADTSTSAVATLGGMVGNNSAGMRSLVYGTTADQVVGLRCVLGGGETVELARCPAPRRSGARAASDAEAGLLRCAPGAGRAPWRRDPPPLPEIVRRVSGYGLDALLDPDTSI